MEWGIRRKYALVNPVSKICGVRWTQLWCVRYCSTGHVRRGKNKYASVHPPLFYKNAVLILKHIKKWTNNMNVTLAPQDKTAARHWQLHYLEWERKAWERLAAHLTRFVLRERGGTLARAVWKAGSGGARASWGARARGGSWALEGPGGAGGSWALYVTRSPSPWNISLGVSPKSGK